MIFKKDVDEKKWSKEVLETLLIDRTTKRNIIWGTDDYEYLGHGYNSHSPISIHLVLGSNIGIIRPRILKTKEHQGNRTKKKAEVFTPSWVCNIQNNLVDNAWFGREDVFNKEDGKTWKATVAKIVFSNNKSKSWQKYVDERRMEITCGEAPYLVSRYDTVLGEFISLYQRIGMLDRKMRLVSENTETEEEWIKWSERAFQSIYGFEFQGDSLLIARKNLLASYCDYMEEKLNREPTEKELLKIARIISWNLWQMDGLTFTIPFQKVIESNEQLSFFEDEKKEEKVMCIIKDWRTKKTVTFQSLLNRGEKKNG